MIVGIGTDLVKISRITSLHEKQGERFARRILSELEWEEFAATKQKNHFLAKRFAVKEAAAKALGMGFRQGIEYKDIAVLHDELRCPILVFQGQAEIIKQQKIFKACMFLSVMKKNML